MESSHVVWRWMPQEKQIETLRKHIIEFAGRNICSAFCLPAFEPAIRRPSWSTNRGNVLRYSALPLSHFTRSDRRDGHLKRQFEIFSQAGLECCLFRPSKASHSVATPANHRSVYHQARMGMSSSRMCQTVGCSHEQAGSNALDGAQPANTSGDERAIKSESSAEQPCMTSFETDLQCGPING